MILSIQARTELFCDHCGKTLVMRGTKEKALYEAYRKSQERGWKYEEETSYLCCPTCQMETNDENIFSRANQRREL